MKLSDKLLKSLGFEAILFHHWRKGNFGITRYWKEDKEFFIVSGVNNHPELDSLETLKRIYKEVTGEEL